MPSPNPQRFACPRCGESLPQGATRCDACGAFLAPASGGAPAEPAGVAQERTGVSTKRQTGPKPAARHSAVAGGISGTSWMLLVVGLLIGGAIGYTLRGTIAPREEGGAPQGPADVMGGSSSGAPAGQMPAEVLTQIQRYREVLAKNPDDVEANVGLGNLLYDSGQWQKAIEHYDHALQKRDNPDVRVDMAVAYHQLGQDQRAREEMERVTRDHPDHRNAWLNLGVVSLSLGDRAAAIRAWERYLKLDPNGEHAQSIRAQIEELKRGS